MSSTNPRLNIDCWLVYWDQDVGFETIKSNSKIIRSICPFWYQFAGVSYNKFPGSENKAIVEFAKLRGNLVIPTIRDNSGLCPGIVINDANLRSKHIAQLVILADEFDYDGIDIDYETLMRSDRSAFTSFIIELGIALHESGKLLTVCLAAKTSEPGTRDTSIAQDWSTIGKSCDRVRILSYDKHWRTSTPGPVAPIQWVEDVMKHAVNVIPREKIILGVPFYGYDWPEKGVGEGVTWASAIALASKYNIIQQWDEPSKTPWLTYIEDCVLHTVWFENAQSLEIKLAIAKKYGIYGVCFWRLGNEDPDNWALLNKLR